MNVSGLSLLFIIFLNIFQESARETAIIDNKMKKVIHRAEERGFADHGWLKSYHSFSFAGYYNKNRMQFGALRVLNDDSVAAGMGFGMHPHANMEIVSIPLEGALKHEDNMGNTSIIKSGDVQIMSAGTGVQHSEYNHSSTDYVKFLQIWILPKEKNIKPRYEQKTYSPEGRRNKLQTVVSAEKGGEGLRINQDAWFSLADLDENFSLHYQLKKAGNCLYVFVLHGKISCEGETLHSRDAIGIEEANSINIKGLTKAEILIMEIPMVK